MKINPFDLDPIPILNYRLGDILNEDKYKAEGINLKKHRETCDKNRKKRKSKNRRK